MDEIKRGDIWYIESGYSVGSEQRPGRPAVVVSNDLNNAHSTTVEVVYLTTQPKRELPTHAVIRSLSRDSTAICEQITTVAKERIGNYCGRATNDEMKNIEAAIRVSLGLRESETAYEDAPPHLLETKLVDAEARCAILQQMCDTLLNRLIEAR